METINPTFSYLTNLEVMQILQKIKTTKKKFGMRNLATVTYEALQYLEETPCKTQTRDSIVNYVKDLSSYRLKSHEILQMVNDPPTSALHTQLLIDDNKAPLTDEQNEKIIQLSYKHFHGSEGKETKDGHAEPTARQMPAKSTSKSAPAKAPEPEAAAIVPDAEAESPPLTEESPAEESNPEAEATQTEAEAINPTEEDANPATAAESKEPGDQPKE